MPSSVALCRALKEGPKKSISDVKISDDERQADDLPTSQRQTMSAGSLSCLEVSDESLRGTSSVVSKEALQDAC